MTLKQLIGINGKPVRGKYSVDRVIVKYNGNPYHGFTGWVKGDNHGVEVAPAEEYFDPEYETQCKKIVTDWLAENAGEYRNYQLHMETKRRADKYYTEIPDWSHNGNMVPNSQREAIREYLEQLHASDETTTADKKESDAATSIDSDATIATLGGLLITALTALYNATQNPAPIEIAEEPAVESTCYVVRLYGYNPTFIGDHLYSNGSVTFDNLHDAIKYALNHRKARGIKKNFGGSMIDRNFESDNGAGIVTVMTILPTGEIETTSAEVKRILEKLADADEETGAVELKISEVPAEDSVTFVIHQSPLDAKPLDRSLDSETPATGTTIFLQPTSDKAAAKDLSDTVLDLKISADEIEEMLAGGYTLGDSERASIAKAQELMKQALAELAKLKSIDTAA